MGFYFSFLVEDSLQLGFQLLACLPQMVNFLCMSLNSIGVIIIIVIIAIIVIIVIIAVAVIIMIEILHLFLGLPSLSRFLLDHLARHPQIRHLMTMMIMMMMMMVMMVMIPTIS